MGVCDSPIHLIEDLVEWQHTRAQFGGGGRSELEIIRHLLVVHHETCQQCFGKDRDEVGVVKTEPQEHEVGLNLDEGFLSF